MTSVLPAKDTIEASLRELAIEEYWLQKPAQEGDQTARRCIELIRRDRDSLQRRLVTLEAERDAQPPPNREPNPSLIRLLERKKRRGS